MIESVKELISQLIAERGREIAVAL